MKAIIAAYIVETMRQRPAVESEEEVLLYFFCNNRYENQNSATAVLRGLTCQLLKKKPCLGKLCEKDLIDTNYAQTILSFGALCRIFVALLDDYQLRKVTCISNN